MILTLSLLIVILLGRTPRMDFLNRAYSQLYDLYRSMTPGSRLTAGLLAAVVLLSLGYLFTHQASAPDVDLMHGVPVAAGQLPAMEAAFAKANLKGYEIRGTSIRVPRGQEAAYMAALADAKALPPNFGTALSEAVSAGNPFENSRAARATHQDRQARRVGADHPLDARNRERLRALRRRQQARLHKDKVITATASVKPAGSGQLDEARVSAIRHLVAGAIAGLKPENVTVSDLNGRTWYGNPDDAGSAEENTLRLPEADLRAGPEGQNPQCAVFHPQRHRGAERGAGPRASHPHQAGPTLVRRRTTAQRRRDQRTRQGEPGRPIGNLCPAAEHRHGAERLAGRLPRRRRRGGSGRSGSDSDEQVEKESVGLTPILARVSVGVPISYFKKVWQERNPAESGQPAERPTGRAGSDSQRRNRRRFRSTWPNCCRRPKAWPRRRSWSP